MIFTIVPFYEPNGAGNGWIDCEDAVATSFTVFETVDDMMLESFDTREKAEKYIEENA